MVDMNNKDVEATAAKADHVPVDAPPSYTPQTLTPINPPQASSSASNFQPPLVELPAERIHAPGPAFSQNLFKVRDQPANVVCPRCHYGVQTQIKSRVGTHAGVWSLICCLTCGVIGAILPLVIPACQDIEHTCPHCGFLMARYRRGMEDAKVFPVVEGPNAQGYQPIPPPPEFPQQSGYTDQTKN